jgi:hypothetical protein
MREKLQRLLRHHRNNVFHEDQATADAHHRALRRLKRTRTYIAMCESSRADAEYRASERLLRMYA